MSPDEIRRYFEGWAIFAGMHRRGAESLLAALSELERDDLLDLLELARSGELA